MTLRDLTPPRHSYISAAGTAEAQQSLAALAFSSTRSQRHRGSRRASHATLLNTGHRVWQFQEPHTTPHENLNSGVTAISSIFRAGRRIIEFRHDVGAHVDRHVFYTGASAIT